MNSELDPTKLINHRKHNVEIVDYGVQGTILNVSLECLTCNEVLADADVLVQPKEQK